jgi:hypothetical protein
MAKLRRDHVMIAREMVTRDVSIRETAAVPRVELPPGVQAQHDWFDWPAVFAGDEILTTAILDRLLHHVRVLSIDGRSYRLRELGALLGPSAEPPRHPPATKGGSPT